MKQYFRIIFLSFVIVVVGNYVLLAQSSMGFRAYRIAPAKKIQVPANLTTIWQSLPATGIEIVYNANINRNFFKKNKLSLDFRVGTHAQFENVVYTSFDGNISSSLSTTPFVPYFYYGLNISQRKYLIETEIFGLEMKNALGFHFYKPAYSNLVVSLVSQTQGYAKILLLSTNSPLYPIPSINSQLTFYNKYAGKKRFSVSIFGSYSPIAPMKVKYYIGDIYGNSTSGVTKRRWLVLGVEIGYTLQK
jgi:hypothetical protein